MSWSTTRFENLYAEPSRNGLYKEKEFHGAGTRIVNMKELFAFPFIKNQEMQRLRLTDTEFNKFSLQPGDLLFARRSLVEEGAGKCVTVMAHDEPMVFESSIIRVRLRQDCCNPLFYYYYFQSPVGRSVITAIVTGVAQKGIRGSELANVQVHNPALSTQKRIADILSRYDRLIDNNSRRIALLEESIHLLYQEWFVRSRFPGYEGVQVVDRVPEGWCIIPATQAIYFSPKTTAAKGEERPYVPMEAVSTNSMILTGIETRAVGGGTKFKNGDTLLARITPCLENGKTAFVQFMEDDQMVATGSTEFIVMRSAQVTPYWVYCLARSHHFRQHAINSMAGSDGRQRVKSDCFAQFQLILPHHTFLNILMKLPLQSSNKLNH